MQGYLLRVIAGLLVLTLLLLSAAGQIDIRFMRQLERWAYDWKVRLFSEPEIDPRIVIIDIDETSLSKEGHWPWPRAKLGKMVKNLFEVYGVDTVAFDVVFAEPETINSLLTLGQVCAAQGDQECVDFVNNLSRRFEPDKVFANEFTDRQVILGYYFTTAEGQQQTTGLLPAPLFSAETKLTGATRATHATGHTANLPVLQNQSAGAGFFSNPLVDEDGVFRRVPLLHEYQGALYESLALATARTYLTSPVEALLTELDRESGYTPLEAITVGPVTIGVDANAAALIPYRGPQGSYRYISAYKVLNQTVENTEELADIIALVGSTAVGLMDTRATPVQSVYPGVEVHANVISGIMDESFKNKPAYMLAVEIILLLVVGVLLVFFLPILSPFWMTIAFLFSFGSVSVLSLYLWQHGSIVMPVAASFVLIAGLYVINATYGFFVESRSKQQLGKRFGQYVPPELVEEMSKNPSRYSLEAEKREMTVLFTDVRGFTTISESLNPKDLSDLMNTFLTEMTTIVHKHRGTIDKYMGDAMMAFWGAPVADENHALHAVEASLEMISALVTVNKIFQQRDWPIINIGIGLNTGEMNVGNMGSEFRMAYTAMGDAVNLGSRLEGLTKQYGAPIIVSETTVQAVKDYAYREIDRVRVKGKTEPVTIYEPLGPVAEIDPAVKEEIKQLEDGIANYRAQRWNAAEETFRSLWEKHNDVMLYDIYLQRISYFKDNPPGDEWDGVFTHLLK